MDVINAVRTGQLEDDRPAIDEEAITGLKFSEGLPVALATEMIQHRMSDPEALRQTVWSHSCFGLNVEQLCGRDDSRPNNPFNGT